MHEVTQRFLLDHIFMSERVEVAALRTLDDSLFLLLEDFVILAVRVLSLLYKHLKSDKKNN